MVEQGRFGWIGFERGAMNVMRLLVWLVIACLAIGQLVGGILTAIYAANALFWLSAKALLLCFAALVVTTLFAMLLKRVVAFNARQLRKTE